MDFKPGINIRDVWYDLLHSNIGGNGNWKYRKTDEGLVADIFSDDGTLVATTKIGITLEYEFSAPKEVQRETPIEEQLDRLDEEGDLG